MTLHRSAQGKMVDMNKLAKQNELTLAVGNVRVNARGDQIGPGGEIIKKREEVVASYYDTPAKKSTVSNTEAPEIVPPQVVAPTPAPTKTTKNQQQSTEE
jgi:hypothetical protein